MVYNRIEKEIAKEFISCKIPEDIKWNEFNFINDTMECYESLFYFAHCILEDVSSENLDHNMLKALADGAFKQLIADMRENDLNIYFCGKTLDLFEIMEHYNLLGGSIYH